MGEKNSVIEKSMKEKYPIAVAIEEAGYQILSLSCITEKVFDLDRDKAVDKPVMSIKVMPNKELKMFSLADQALN